jgi:hypothetical protein
MKKGITYLIEQLETQDKKKILTRNFAREFINGIASEPERLGELIEAYTNAYHRANPFFPDYITRKKVLESIAVHALIADGLIKRAEKEDNEHIEEYYLDKKNYGPAMNAFSKYIGLEEKELFMKIFYLENN